MRRERALQRAAAGRSCMTSWALSRTTLGGASQLVRVSHRPAASRSKERVRTKDAGFLKACIERAHECSVFDDLCSSVVAMKQPYRGDAEACIGRSCTEMAGCLYTEMGRTKPD